MNQLQYLIEEFDNSIHRGQVIELWESVFGYEAEHNSPAHVIDSKLQNDDNLFFIASLKTKVMGTVMAGYDGHRGWIYSMAVMPEYQKQGIGSELLLHAQNKLKDLGCMKINLQIIEGKKDVEKFYLANGFSIEQRISMGKKMYYPNP